MKTTSLPTEAQQALRLSPGITAVAALCISLQAVAAEVPSSEQAPVEQALEQAATPAFDILEYRIEGNSVLSALSIERAVYPHLGPGKSIEDVEKARTALEKVYQQAGFLTVLVDIPEQKVDGGIVTLRVVEGKVSKLRVAGARYYSSGRIRNKVAQLQPGQVPNFPEVQAELGKVARTQDRQVAPVLRPGQSPGTVEVELKVEDKLPLHGSLELNNRQTANTKPLRLAAFLRYDNLWQREHSISLQFQTAPQDTQDLRVFSASYVLPVSDSGSVLALYGVHSNSDVTALGTTNVIGQGTILGGRYVMPLRARGSYFHAMTLGLDYKDFDENVLLGADQFETPITYVPVMLEYRLNVAGEKRTHAASISLNSAPRGFLGNDDEEFAAKRAGARASYLFLRGDWTTEQRVGEKSLLRGRLAGQLTNDPLISNEQFGAGGADSVRGYLEVESLGDVGLVGSLEWRRALTLPGFAAGWVKSMEALAFGDAGLLRVVDALPGQDDRFELYGAGLGLRALGARYWEAALDLAVPFKDGPETDKGDPRVHFRVAAKF